MCEILLTFKRWHFAVDTAQLWHCLVFRGMVWQRLERCLDLEKQMGDNWKTLSFRSYKLQLWRFCIIRSYSTPSAFQALWKGKSSSHSCSWTSFPALGIKCPQDWSLLGFTGWLWAHPMSLISHTDIISFWASLHWFGICHDLWTWDTTVLFIYFRRDMFCFV